MMDENKIEKAISKKTKFIIPTQLNGRVCEMTRIYKLLKNIKLKLWKMELKVLSKIQRKILYNFWVNWNFKFLSCEDIRMFWRWRCNNYKQHKSANKILKLRDHGRGKNSKVETWGTNCRLDNIQALVLDIKLKFLKKDLSRRREIAKIYNNGLKILARYHCLLVLRQTINITTYTKTMK